MSQLIAFCGVDCAECGVETCAHCPDYEIYPTIQGFLQYVLPAKITLDEIYHKLAR